jgi:hypothetical protein
MPVPESKFSPGIGSLREGLTEIILGQAPDSVKERVTPQSGAKTSLADAFLVENNACPDIMYR